MAQGLTKEIFTYDTAAAGFTAVPALNSPTAYDGKNVWFTGTTGGVSTIIIVSFWGPYTSLDNDEFPRWAEPATDEVSIDQMGPKIRLIAYISPGKLVKQFIRSETNVMTVVYTDNTWVRYSTDTYSVLSSVSYPKPTISYPPLFTGPFLDNTGTAYTPISKWVLDSTTSRNYIEVGAYKFAIGPAPTTQTGADRNIIYQYDSVGLVSFQTIPGRKQVKARYIATNDGKLYIGGYNSRSVLVLSATDMSLIATLDVNRDVDEIFVYDGLVYVSSRNGLLSTIDKYNVVVDIGNSATRDYYIAKVGTVTDAEWYGKEEIAVDKYDAGHTVWDVVSTGGSKSARYVNKTTRKGKQFNLYSSDVASVVYVPEQKYEYYVGTTFTPVTVPAHLLFFRPSKVICAIRFPGIYYGGITKNYGGVMAVSTGTQRYKGDDI